MSRIYNIHDPNYMFHWTNKVGGWVEDEYFNDILKESKNGAAN